MQKSRAQRWKAKDNFLAGDFLREERMVKVSVFYKNAAGAKFNADYFLSVHMPLAVRLLAAGIKSATAEIGTRGTADGDAPPFAAIANFTSESADDFMNAFMEVGARLQADIPNYTDIEPLIQVSNLTEFSLASG
jgi:uncharacterized protein (TIGR02118 family)